MTLPFCTHAACISWSSQSPPPLRQVQVLQKRLDKALLLRELLGEDMLPTPFATECPSAKSLVVREQNELDVAIATVVDEVHQINIHFAEGLGKDQPESSQGAPSPERCSHTFLHFVIEPGTGSILTSRHSSCHFSSFVVSVP
jgi:hypothetical protein